MARSMRSESRRRSLGRVLDACSTGFTASHLSIDIGSRCIKAVESTVRAGRLAIVKAICFETPSESVVNGSVRDVVAVGAALRRNLLAAKIGTARATTCIPSPAAVLKRFTLPLAEAGRLDRMVRAEIETLASFGSDSLCVDYQVGEAAAEETLAVLVAAARKETVGGYVDALKSADLQPHAVDIDSLAVANMIDAGYGVDPSRTVAFVHVGAEFCALGIRSHGVWVFTGSVGVGTDRAVRPPESAERCAGAGDIAREIDGALRFYWPESAGDRLDEIVLSGGGARMPQLVAALAECSGRSVRVIQSVDLASSRDAYDAALFAVATGLALRTLVAP